MTAARATVSTSYVPEALPRAEAARYVGLGETTFLELVDKGEMPRPRRFRNCRRVVWLKRELDLALQELPVDGVDQSDEYAGVEL